MSRFTLNETLPAEMADAALESEMTVLRSKLIEAALYAQARRIENSATAGGAISATFQAWLEKNRGFIKMVATRLGEVKAEWQKRVGLSRVPDLEKRIAVLERRLANLEAQHP